MLAISPSSSGKVAAIAPLLLVKAAVTKRDWLKQKNAITLATAF
jgi:hypothetical protein